MGTGRRIRITHITHDAGKTRSTHEESVTSGFFEPQPTTFKDKLKRHCARFWWLHLIIFVVGFLATTLPMFDYRCHPCRSQADNIDVLVSSSCTPSSLRTLSTMRKSQSTLYTSQIQRRMVLSSRSIPHFPPIQCTRQILMRSTHHCICRVATYPSSRSRFQAPHRALPRN